MKHLYIPKSCALTSGEVTKLKSEAIKAVQGKNTTVGAAVLTLGRKIFSGHYIKGSTCYTSIHAEMAAISNAICSDSSKIIAIAIYFVNKSPKVRQFPCGTCLQLLFDNKSEDELWVIIGSNNKAVWKWHSLSNLFPHPWTNS